VENKNVIKLNKYLRQTIERSTESPEMRSIDRLLRNYNVTYSLC